MASNAGLTFKLFGEDVSASEALDKLGGKGKKVAGGISAAFGGMALGSAFADSLDTETTMATFKAGLGATPEVAKKAGDLAGQLYRDGIGGSLEEVTGAIGAMGTQFGDIGNMAPDDIKGIATAGMNLSKVMGVDVGEVMRSAGQISKNFGVTGETAMNIIATGATNGANASGDLLDTFNEYGDSFSSIGIGADTMLGMINNGLASGIVSSDKAADAFNEFGIRAIDGSKSTGNAYAALGLDANKMAHDIAGGGPAAEAATGQIMTALGNMTDPVAQEAAGVALFGSMWEDVGKTSILAMNPAAVATKDMSNATKEMGDTLQGTAQTKVDAMRRTFEGMMQSFVSAPGPIGTVGTLLMGMGPQGMQMVASLGAAGAALKDLGITTKIATAIQWLFNAAMDANPIGLVVLAIAALIAVFVLLWKNCEGFRNFFLGMWEKIKQVIGAVVDWFKRAWDAVLSWFKNLWQGIKDKLSAIWDGIKSVVSGVIDWFKSSWENIKTWFTNLWNNVIGFFKGVWNGAVGFIGGVLSRIGGLFTGMWDGLKRGAQAAWDWVRGIFEGVRDWFGRIFGAIGDTIRNALGFVGDFLKAPINGLIGMVNWMIDRINGIHFTVPDWVPGIGGRDFGVHLGHISYLAEGGVVMPRSGGTHAVIGEAGEPEAVIPLSKWGAMSGGGGTHYHIHLPTGAVIGTADTVAVAVADAVKGARRRGLIPAGAI